MAALSRKPEVFLSNQRSQSLEVSSVITAPRLQRALKIPGNNVYKDSLVINYYSFADFNKPSAQPYFVVNHQNNEDFFNKTQFSRQQHLSGRMETKLQSISTAHLEVETGSG
ncbi:hypothetical protein LOAG_15836 [Loa loa]|uniref:Uncharacterized protein n=1 Tax=Loa loa TaxID=7209 RepID=A0A1S0TG13_LOALO|nr:hypothetical protein LOAG_15836 [Loa loa]EFO12696.1 hypothetical protein LOAG_15836 [Loa loa]